MDRGLGPAKKADPLPLEILYNLSPEQFETGRRTYWPAIGLDAAGISSAWLLRELESSSAALSDLVLHESVSGSTCGWAEWTLPATKTDTKAEGVVRSLACACPSPLCPVSAARRAATASELVRHQTPMVTPADQAPLFCKVNGEALLKKEVVEFYRDLVRIAGLEGLHITGHSARVTGAMRMARAGHQVWTIQVFGRWGSPAILGYVRDAILGAQGGGIAQITEGTDKTSLDLAKVRDTVKRAAHVQGESEQSQKRATQAVAKVVLEQLRLKSHWTDMAERGSGLNGLEECVSIVVEEVRSYAENNLKLGRIRVLQSKKGLLHMALNAESALCGWTWARHGAKVMKRSGPVVGETTGWCPRCHSWAIAIAEGD